MAQSQQVGFQLQGDVFGAGSMVYQSAGRLLKSLSDGGIDWLAVCGSVWLGDKIPITASKELSVSRSISSCGGRVGFLTKTLRIGWGHTDAATELARTRSGSAALLLINALAVGGTSFDAAVGLRELLLLYGAEQSLIPNVDVLLTMVRFLAPFLHNCGFRSIHEQIHTAVTRECKARRDLFPSEDLNCVGEPAQWTRAIKQLILTAERRERVYLIVAQRASWLAALSIHLLGMAVEVRVHSQVVWESAGTQGVAVFQLATFGDNAPSAGLELRIPRPSTSQGFNAVLMDYPMETALQTFLESDSRITDAIANMIHDSITITARDLMETCSMTWSYSSNTKTSLRERWAGERSRLFAVCRDLGIISKFCDGEARPEGTSASRLGSKSHIQKGFAALNEIQFKHIQAACGGHSAASEPKQPAGDHQESMDRYRVQPDCLCRRIGRLIDAYAATVLALLQCEYDSSALRVMGKMIFGEEHTCWTRSIAARNEKNLRTGPASTTLDNNQLLDHLSHIFHEEEAAFNGDAEGRSKASNLLAISAGHLTIYHKAILDQQCFTAEGQIIRISMGRISFDNALRRIVEETKVFPKLDDTEYAFNFSHAFGNDTPLLLRSSLSRMAPGVEIVPHYAEGSVLAGLQTSLSEKAIQVSCFVTSHEKSTKYPIDICLCIERLLQCRGPSKNFCTHVPENPFTTDSRFGAYAVATFCGYQHTTRDQNTLVLYALKGRGIEQLVQASFLLPSRTVLQADSCIECAIDTAIASWPWNLLANAQDESRMGIFRGSAYIIMTN